MKSLTGKLLLGLLLIGIIRCEEEEKEYRPEANVILPIRREGTVYSKYNMGPCGGVKKLLANTMVNEGATLNFVWETINPEVNGNCTVSLSKGFETEGSFEVLNPTSNFNADGSFECGRTKGFESKEFKLPPDYECDRCIMQFKWKTDSGVYYSCSDVLINGTSLAACMSKCQNGGQCFNGQCICIDGYTGEFCENEPGNKAPVGLILLGILAAGLLAAVIYMLYKRTKNTRSWKADKDGNAQQPFAGNENYFGSEFQEPVH